MGNREYRTVADPAQRPAELYEPTRALNRESDVQTPRDQAAIIGGLSAALVLLLLFLVAEVIAVSDTVLIGLPLFVFLAVTLAVFVGRVAWIDANTVAKTETLLGVDLNRDGKVGPDAHPMVVNGRKVDAQAGDRERAEFERFITVVCRPGAKTDFRSLAGERFKGRQAAMYRNLLIDNGMAERGRDGTWHVVKPLAEVLEWSRQHVQWLPGRRGR